MLDGKKPIAVGYKIFNWDWTGYNDYSYADENGEVEGSVHTVTGDLEHCGWGLHYCENPVDCMRYRDLIQWNKFALVEAYDENIKRGNDDKSVCRTLKIKKVLSFDDMIKACKEYQVNGYGIHNGSGISNGSAIRNGYGIRNGSGISGGYGIHNGYAISNGYGIHNGFGIHNGSAISNGSGISDSSAIRNGYGIRNGSGISGGYGIHNGSGISNGYAISNGYGIHNGYGISDGYAISGGYGISNGYGISDGYGIRNGYGIRDGSGINASMHCRKCKGISRCIFCDGLEGAKLMIFNKPVTVGRFGEVWSKLNGWKPDFTNAQQLKREFGDDKWANTPVFEITSRKASEVYAEMPRKLREYIKAMPEYDDEIFKAITGEADE